ncbi:MAG: phage holin family protein [Candidatus Omnitrophota bacterium]|nr:phage holin family protein [Candidatus Omnitrophota bacterium]
MSRDNGSSFKNIGEAFYGAWRFYKNNSVELARIEMARFYLKSVETVRQAGLAVYGLLMFTGISMLTVILLHVLVYISVPHKTAAVAGLFLVDACLVAWLGRYLFSQKQWMKYAANNEWMMAGIFHHQPGKENEERFSPNSSGT